MMLLHAQKCFFCKGDYYARSKIFKGAVLPFTSLSEQLPLIVLRKCLRSIWLKARTFVIQCKVAPKDFAGEKRYVF